MMTGHPLCNQTVSIYHCGPEGVTRRVVSGCFYRWHRQHLSDGLEETKFLLILPAGESVQIGDRVYDGVGPAQVVWENFLPVNTPGLSQVAYVTPFVFQGRLHHTEAGRK